MLTDVESQIVVAPYLTFKRNVLPLPLLEPKVPFILTCNMAAVPSVLPGTLTLYRVVSVVVLATATVAVLLSKRAGLAGAALIKAVPFEVSTFPEVPGATAVTRPLTSVTRAPAAKGEISSVPATVTLPRSAWGRPARPRFNMVAVVPPRLSGIAPPASIENVPEEGPVIVLLKVAAPG